MFFKKFLQCNVSLSKSKTFCSAIKTPSYVTKITGKRVIKIEGSDSVNILQGLTTSNMKQFVDTKENGLCHTSFQTTQGRIITDGIVIKPTTVTKEGVTSKENELWLEVSDELSQPLLTHLKKHSFRKKIKFEDQTDIVNIYALYSPFEQLAPKELRANYVKEFYSDLTPENLQNEDPSSFEDLYIDNCSYDPRHSVLGTRIYGCSISKKNLLIIDQIFPNNFIKKNYTEKFVSLHYFRTILNLMILSKKAFQQFKQQNVKRFFAKKNILVMILIQCLRMNLFPKAAIFMKLLDIFVELPRALS